MKKTRALSALGGLLVLFAACGKDRAGGESETHWMKQCERDSDCAGSAQCSCGMCTTECSSASDCSGLGASMNCAPSSEVPSCGANVPEAKVCLASCSSSSECPSGFECSVSGCTPAPPGGSGSGGSGGIGGSPESAAAGAGGDAPSEPDNSGGTAGDAAANKGGTAGDADGPQTGGGISRAGSDAFGGAPCIRDRGGLAGGVSVSPVAPADGVACPLELEGVELCTPKSSFGSSAPVLSRCSAGVWSTIEADSDCVNPECIGREENCHLECNVPGAADNVCCDGARFCSRVGVCYGRWWTLGISTCGDGVKEGNETCDDGNLNPFDDCLETCVRARCGDGVVQMTGQNVEQCDEGDNNGPPPARCSGSCTLN